MEFVKEEEFGIFEGNKKAYFQSKFFSDSQKSYLFLDINTEYEKVMNVSTRLHSRKTQIALWSILKSKIYFSLEKLDRENTGIVVMTTRGYVTEEYPLFDSNESQSYGKLRKNINPTYVIKNEVGIIPGHLAIALKLNGPTYTLVSNNSEQAICFLELELNSNPENNYLFVWLKTFEDEFSNEMQSLAIDSKECIGCFLINSKNFLAQSSKIRDLRWE